MPYEIQNGSFHSMEIGRRRGKGRWSPYPLREMYPGQWIRVPLAEEMKLFRCVRNARYKAGVKVRVYMEAGGQNWIVQRVE